jgi:hypothetical protein
MQTGLRMNLDELERRPSEYVRDSGAPFLGTGSFWAIQGVLQLIWPVIARTNRNAALTVEAAGMAFAMLVVVGVLVVQQRVVMRRTGYAAPRPSSPPLTLLFLILFGGVALVLILFLVAPKSADVFELAAPGFAAFLGLSVAILAWQRKNGLGYCFAAYLMLLCVVLWWARPGSFASLAWLEIGAGLPVAIYGAVRLRQFLKANPAPVEAE